MILVQLQFDERMFPEFSGEMAEKFFLAMLTEQPGFAVKAADEVTVRFERRGS